MGSKVYSVSPESIRFDDTMVKFNRVHTELEYQATKESIRSMGQQLPINVNDQTGLCENGRHRVIACTELGIDVLCEQIDGNLPVATRLELYNLDTMSGRDLTVPQKAIQAHKYAVLSDIPLSQAAVKFKVNIREVRAAAAIVGISKDSQVFPALESEDCVWVNPEGKKMKSLRTIDTYLKAANEELEEKATEDPRIDYADMINTAKGKQEYWRMRTLVQMSPHELNMMLVKYMNYEYVLKVDNKTGEVVQ